MHYPSKTAVQIAARVWCDQAMGDVVMDIEAVHEIGRIIDKVREKQTKPKPARLKPPPGLVHAIHSEPLVAAVWQEAERAGASVEVALTTVALELLADNVRYRRAEVERVMGRPRVVFMGVEQTAPTVVESAP